MHSRLLVIIALAGVLSAPGAFADEQASGQHVLPRVELMDVLDAVAKKSGRNFVVDRRVDKDLVIGQVDVRRMTYPVLLVVLRNNGLAAIEYNSVTSIIDKTTIRQYPLPVITELDDSIHDEAWITMLVEVENANATQFVPILRPMLPKQGHMVAHKESNTITIVDSYGNVKRVLDLIQRMDVKSAQP